MIFWSFFYGCLFVHAFFRRNCSPVNYLRLKISYNSAATCQYNSARLAQSVEHETLNLRVVGSSPTLGVILIPFYRFFFICAPFVAGHHFRTRLYHEFPVLKAKCFSPKIQMNFCVSASLFAWGDQAFPFPATTALYPATPRQTFCSPFTASPWKPYFQGISFS